MIRMSTISCLLELNKCDKLEELSPDDEDLLDEFEEYEIEEDDLKKKSKVVKEKYDVQDVDVKSLVIESVPILIE